MVSDLLDVKTAEAQEVPPTSGSSETTGVNEKDGAFTSGKDIEQGAKYESDGMEEGVTNEVETATDLVTKIIHVNDDPNMTVVTFRVVFLG
jgi:hypothetical protein